MSSASNPRRRPARQDDSHLTLIDSFQSMSIRKGETFHPNTNTNTSGFWDPLESRAKSPAMPLRSTTSPQSLEDLLIGPGERRVAQLLDRVDKAVAAQSTHALANVLSEPETLNAAAGEEQGAPGPDQSARARTRHHSHSSDSGIGSSVADSTETASDSTAKHSSHTATGRSSSRHSLSSISDAAEENAGLSKYAAEQIHKHIVEPILEQESLKEFHDLIKSIPPRIEQKEVKTLREVERTLLFLATDYSRSPSKYLRFCESTIRVLHTTVTTLHESDQKAPQDRPYTQGYFFDLVEQIRRYATILAANRARQVKGEMDPTKVERVSLHGGVTQNGKPAELVRHTADGKVISLASGQALTEEEFNATMKRAADEADLDEDATRSMARRKKNAKPEIHNCPICEKEFKRPCDLTKHVKTHERPWKCPTEGCKYYEYGWPTEKERDRHVNDKHSDTPSLYHCLYKPCPYTSKRESNCKQHMEKAHGWNYVRSKSNGKGRASSVVRLQHGSVPPSPASAMLTPLTPIAPSPSTNSWSESSRRGSMAPPPTTGASGYGTPAYGTPAFGQPSPDFAGHFNMNNLNFDFNDMSNFPAFPITPATSEERYDSASLSSHSELQFDGNSFDGHSPADFNFDNFDFTNLPNDFHSYTPNSSVAGPSNTAANGLPHVSPQMDQTFTNDAMNIDADYSTAPNEDFTLFASGSRAAHGDMIPNLVNEGSWGNLDGQGSTFASGSHFDNNGNGNPPPLTAGNTMLAELFPELNN